MSRTVLLDVNGEEIYNSGIENKKKGKSYANKKSKENRPEGDFYCTPKSLIWVAEDIIKAEFKQPNCPAFFEPCSGNDSITEELRRMEYGVLTNDLYNKTALFNKNFLEINFSNWHFAKEIITNPPFSLWDEFVKKAKTFSPKFMFIGRLNYFGTQSRLEENIWKNLKAVYPFNRYVDYQTPYREDGLFHVGAMATAWFLWDMGYTGLPHIEILDVSKYAKLGNFKK